MSDLLQTLTARGFVQDLTPGLEERLRGFRYDRESIGAALSGVEVSDYFGPVTREDVLTLLFG